MTNNLRKMRGLVYATCKNETELASKIGWTRQRLNKITTGKKVPDIRELALIANALCVPISTIADFFLE